MLKIVVNGTFDILHPGHLKLLEKARKLGDYVLVCIDSDRRVTELKGYTRPINNEAYRMDMLYALKCVDEVEIFDTAEELEEILQFYQADIMVKGSDYKDKPIIGDKLCGSIVYLDILDEYSTSKKVQDIITRG